MFIDVKDEAKRRQQLVAINEALGKDPRRGTTKLVEISDYYAPLIQYALAQRLKQTTRELELLKLTRERDLSPVERWQLPSNLQRLRQDQLQEYIDPWISLQSTFETLILEFEI